MDPFKDFKIPGLPPGFGGAFDLSQQAMTQVSAAGGILLVTSLTDHPSGWLLVDRNSGAAWLFVKQLDAIKFADERQMRDFKLVEAKAGVDLGRLMD